MYESAAFVNDSKERKVVMVRVIAGSAKGRRLKQLKTPLTRPATDRLKESLFGVLSSLLAGSSVLDLFAGSGSLGIEALSRGAARADFVESDPAACRTIKANLVLTGFENAARVFRLPAERFLSRARESYDIIFVDPPFAYPGLQGLLGEVVGSEASRPETIVIFRHHSKADIGTVPPGLVLWDRRKFGDNVVLFFKKVSP